MTKNGKIAAQSKGSTHVKQASAKGSIDLKAQAYSSAADFFRRHGKAMSILANE